MFLCSLALEFLVTEIAQPLVHLKQGRAFLKHGDESLRGGEGFKQTTCLESSRRHQSLFFLRPSAINPVDR